MNRFLEPHETERLHLDATRRLHEAWNEAHVEVADKGQRHVPVAAVDRASLHFLGHRAEQHTELAASPDSAIADRSIYEDAHIFARALYHLGNLSERDYKAYRTVFEQVVAGLPRPNLLLYLRAPVPVLLQRIGLRGRAIETGISAEYLSLLETFYDEWLQSFDLCPVLTIRTDDLDFVHKPRHLDIVVKTIQDKLAGKEEIIFPQNGN